MEQFNPMILKGSKTQKCTQCEGIFFTSDTMLQVVSKFKVGSPEDVIIPLTINRCVECGTPVAEQFASIMNLIAESPHVEDNIKPLKRNTGLILE